jgi:hypothetical protein
MANRNAPAKPFTKGESKNPRGRPKGSLNKHSLWQKQMEESAEEWLKRLDEHIAAGDKECLRFALRYALRKEKEAPMAEIELDTSAPAAVQAKQILEAASKGLLSGGELRDYMEGIGQLAQFDRMHVLEQEMKIVKEQLGIKQ